MKINKSLLIDMFREETVFSSHEWSDDIALTIDSRHVPQHSIFMAIKGDISDGHDYIDQAIEQGASLVIAESFYKDRLADKALPVIYVADSLQCFFDLARAHLLSMPAKRIAVTGSNGKTTVKEMLKAAFSAVLGADVVYANKGTFNNHFGVPLSALQVRPEHKIAIFEMGMNHAGEIAHLCQLVRPEFGLITNIGMAHAGNFVDGILGVEAAKGELFSALGPQGCAIINLDDQRVKTLASKFSFGHCSTFGEDQQADVRLVDRQPYCLESGSQKVSFNCAPDEIIKARIPLPGAHNALNAAGALAMVKALRMPVATAAAGLADMSVDAGRLTVMKAQGCLIINDGYNANPISMAAGVMACLELDACRRIAVVGTMGELGTLSDRHHFELGELLAEHFHAIFVCGEGAEPIIQGASHHKHGHICFKKTAEELVALVQAFKQPGDLIFIKGSKSTRMQIIAQALSDQL